MYRLYYAIGLTMSCFLAIDCSKPVRGTHKRSSALTVTKEQAETLKKDCEKSAEKKSSKVTLAHHRRSQTTLHGQDSLSDLIAHSKRKSVHFKAGHVVAGNPSHNSLSLCAQAATAIIKAKA